MLTIKEEYLNTIIFCHITKKDVMARFIPDSLYPLYYNSAYKFLFKKKKKGDDKPN